MAQHSYDPFWLENEPVFHAHDYGGNIKIKVSEGVQSLGREARLRPVEDSEAGSDDDLTDGEGDGGRPGSRLRRDDGGSQPRSAPAPDDPFQPWPLHLSLT